MTAITIIAAIVGLTWGFILLTRGALLAGCGLFLAATCCLGPNFGSWDVAGVTLSLDRVTLALLCVAHVAQWRLGRTDPKPLLKADLLLFAFVGWLALSALVHKPRTTGADAAPPIPHLINGYLIPLAVYWIARQAALTERSVTALLIGLVAFGVYLAFTGVCEVTGQWQFVYPKYIADPDLGLHFGRARGPMVQSVSYGVYLGASLLALWLLVRDAAPRWKVVLAACSPLLLAAIYATKTRSVWLGSGLGLVLVLGLTLRGRVRVAVLGGLLFAGLVVGLVKMDAILGLQREGTIADTRKSVDMRASFTYVSWQMFLDRPLVGFGFGQFKQAKLDYLTDRDTDLDLESIRNYVHHNTFLAVLTETGLVGLFLLLAVLGNWTLLAARLAASGRAPPWSRRQGVLLLGFLCLLFWQMIGHEITFTPIDQSLLYLLAGVTVGLAAREFSPVATSPTRHP